MSEPATSADLRHGGLVLAVLLGVAAALRVLIAIQPGLWADELFSLAIATGHSLEHAAAVADPAEGDYVEPRGAEPAAAFQRYLAHESPPAGVRRVLRAVLLSDTSPPLYYLALGIWARVAGTGDAALRLFSVGCALAAMVLLWSVARAIAGVRVAAIACLLFALAPPVLYYSGEGRMYALTWLVGLALARATLALARGGARPAVAAAWITAAVAGLMTHYFFAFVWAAMLAWLVLTPGRLGRGSLAALTLAVGALVAPWYVHVPASLAAWRVTGGWLDGPPGPAQLAYGVLRLGGSLVNGCGLWGCQRWVIWLQCALGVLLAAAVLMRGLGPLLRGERRLAVLWLAGSVLGPVVFDVLRQTATSQIERYALPGVPAAMLVLAFALDHVARPVGIAVLAGTVIAWLPGVRDVPNASPRPWNPFPGVAAQLADWTRPDDLVIVSSIPSGVLGVARYLDPRTPVASWVVQLGQRRMPADAAALVASRRRIAVVRIHDLGERAPVDAWLREHATFEREVELFSYAGNKVAIAYYARDGVSGADRSGTRSSQFRTRAPSVPGSS